MLRNKARQCFHGITLLIHCLYPRPISTSTVASSGTANPQKVVSVLLRNIMSQSNMENDVLPASKNPMFHSTFLESSWSVAEWITQLEIEVVRILSEHSEGRQTFLHYLNKCAEFTYLVRAYLVYVSSTRDKIRHHISAKDDIIMTIAHRREIERCFFLHDAMTWHFEITCFNLDALRIGIDPWDRRRRLLKGIREGTRSEQYTSLDGCRPAVPVAFVRAGAGPLADSKHVDGQTRLRVFESLGLKNESPAFDTMSESENIASVPSSSRLGLADSSSARMSAVALASNPLADVTNTADKTTVSARASTPKSRAAKQVKWLKTSHRLKKILIDQKKEEVDRTWLSTRFHTCGICTRFMSKDDGALFFCNKCSCYVCALCNCSTFHSENQHELCLAVENKAQNTSPKKRKKKRKQNKRKSKDSDGQNVPSLTIDAEPSTNIGPVLPSGSANDLEDTDPPVFDLVAMLLKTGSIIAVADFIDSQEEQGVDLDFGYDPERDFPFGDIRLRSTVK